MNKRKWTADFPDFETSYRRKKIKDYSIPAVSWTQKKGTMGKLQAAEEEEVEGETHQRSWNRERIAEPKQTRMSASISGWSRWVS